MNEARLTDYCKKIGLDQDAGLHRDFHHLPRRAGRGVGKYPDPFVIDRLANQRAHPERHLDDVIGAAAVFLDRAAEIGEQSGYGRDGTLRGGPISPD